MEKGEPLYYIDINPCEVPGYNAGYDYAIIGVTGGCMDDAASPIAIPDGAHVLGHWISRAEFLANWEQCQGRVVCIFPNDYLKSKGLIDGLTKELVRVDYGWFLVLRMYVPFKEFSVPVDCINDEIMIIDKVIESDEDTRQ